MKTVQWPDEIPCEPKMHTWDHLYGPVTEGLRKFLTDETSVYVELGSWCGGSALVAAKLAPNARIICVDAWDGRGGPQYETGLAARSLQLCQANLWEHRHRVDMIRADSTDGLLDVMHEGIRPDVIYIDADHNYNPAWNDIWTAREYFPWAVICGDDYGQGCGRAADDLFGDRVRVIGNIFWWVE